MSSSRTKSPWGREPICGPARICSIATMGAGVNIGAGSITCNYDGVHKNPTTIGDNTFIGSDTMMVAPVNIGSNAVTGAGGTITKDVPDGALAIERTEQRIITGYSERKIARQ